MDNLTHTLCGLALARAGVDRAGPLVAPVLAVAANVPDADIVIRAQGHLAYLHDHRGITHALLGMAVEAPLVALAGYLIGRLARVEAVRFLPLLLAATLGLLSHFALDLLNTYGVRPWLPFDGTRYHGDAAFIVDPWLWLAFGAAAFLGKTRGPRASALWTSVALLALFVVGGSQHGESWLTALFVVGLAFIAILKRAPIAKSRPRVLALGALGVALAHVAALFATSHLALARGLAAVAPLRGTEDVLRTSTSPQPGVPWRSFVVVETNETLHFVDVDLLRGSTVIAGALAKRLDDPAYARIAGTPEARTWAWFARHPFIARSPSGELILGDARYDPHARASWCNIALPASATPSSAH